MQFYKKLSAGFNDLCSDGVQTPAYGHRSMACQFPKQQLTHQCKEDDVRDLRVILNYTLPIL